MGGGRLRGGRRLGHAQRGRSSGAAPARTWKLSAPAFYYVARRIGRTGPPVIIRRPMKVGIIGLPYVGKSTLFQLLTGARQPAAGGTARGASGHRPRAGRAGGGPGRDVPAQEEDAGHRRVRGRARRRQGRGLGPGGPARPARRGCAGSRGARLRIRRRAPSRGLGGPPARRADAGAGADPGRPGHRRAPDREAGREHQEGQPPGRRGGARHLRQDEGGPGVGAPAAPARARPRRSGAACAATRSSPRSRCSWW